MQDPAPFQSEETAHLRTRFCSLNVYETDTAHAIDQKFQNQQLTSLPSMTSLEIKHSSPHP